MAIKPYVIFENGEYKQLSLDLATTAEMQDYVSGAVGSVSGFIPLTQRGMADGVATLDGDGFVPAGQLNLTADSISGFSAAVSGAIDLAGIYSDIAAKASVAYVDGQITSVSASIQTVSGAVQTAQTAADLALSQNTTQDTAISDAQSAATQALTDIGTVSGYALSAQEDATQALADAGSALNAANAAQDDVDALVSVVNGKADIIHTHVVTDITDFVSGARAASVADAITDGVADIAPSQNAVFDALALKVSTSELGANNGVATLDGGGKVPVAQLPSAVMTYEGMWDASTNSPTLTDGTGDAGMVYRVGVSGSHDFGSGSVEFQVGDYAIYNGSVWEKSDTTDAVASVNGQTGIVTLTTSHITEGSNFYYTQGRFDAGVSGVTSGSSTVGLVSGSLEVKDLSISTAKLAAQSVSSAKLGNIAGLGLSGGNGTALGVNAGAGIKMVSSAVTVDYTKSKTNANAGTITIRQVVYLKADGTVDLAIATQSGLSETILGMVEQASISTGLPGDIVMIPGKVFTNFSGLTPGANYYLSRSTLGGINKYTDEAFVSGDTICKIGRALSATEFLYDPGEPILLG